MKPGFVALALACVALVVLAGCRAPDAKPPKIHVDLPHLGTLWLEGDAAEPAVVDIERGESSLEIPAGTAVSIDAAGVVTFTAAEPVAVRGLRFSAHLTGPQAFPPPAAPSPADLADGRARWFGWIGLFVGAAMIVAGFKGWPMIGTGGACVAGASVAILALSAVPRFVWGIGGAGLALAAFGFALWHLWLKKRQLVAMPT